MYNLIFPSSFFNKLKFSLSIDVRLKIQFVFLAAVVESER
ncbi:unnamed protein product, partial [Brugia timori]|uniref:Uncharacterized protein n=1 Tax=Brugia timori TaxID=42155 RepID=A0A0R3Q712_9BILA